MHWFIVNLLVIVERKRETQSGEGLSQQKLKKKLDKQEEQLKTYNRDLTMVLCNMI